MVPEPSLGTAYGPVSCLPEEFCDFLEDYDTMDAVADEDDPDNSYFHKFVFSFK